MFLLFLTLFGLLSVQSAHTAGQQTPISPETTVFAFDMHKVFMEQNWGILARSLFPDALFIQPGNWFNRHKVGEKHFADLQKKYPHIRGLYARFEEFMLNQKFMLDTVEIIKELHGKGYRLYLLSNCAQETYVKLRIKYPAVFNLFHGEYLPSRHNNYNHKPNISFFKEFSAYLDACGQSSKEVIFIDDKNENCFAASKLKRIRGLQFKSAKKLRQSVQTLELGLPLNN